MFTFAEGLNGILGPVFGFIVGLIPLVVIHEFGHLIMAKIMGVWAREFGIGYPPRIFKMFNWGETEFTLNWIPFGGFVRMEGESTFAEDKMAVDPETKAHSLYSKKPWQRILIYLGGPAMNLITAWLIAILIFTSGIPGLQTVITDVVPDSPAAAANLQIGDALVAINGADVEGSVELQSAIEAVKGQEAIVTVERDGEELAVSLTPREDPPEGEGSMGIMIMDQEVAGSLKRYSLPEAVAYGTRYFGNLASMTVMLPVYIVRMGIPFEQARPVGVIGISQIAEQSVSQSIEQAAPYPYLSLLVMLSISLGIFNLLPIPALDGGRILFSLIEAIRGKALTPALEERIHMIAFAAMLVLFVGITLLDIFMPVPLP
jgi:regulator of sigma E protease